MNQKKLCLVAMVAGAVISGSAFAAYIPCAAQIREKTLKQAPLTDCAITSMRLNQAVELREEAGTVELTCEQHISSLVSIPEIFYYDFGRAAADSCDEVAVAPSELESLGN